MGQGHRQGVGPPARLQPPPEGVRAAVGGVTGDPPRGDARREGPRQELLGQRQLGGEPDAGGHPRLRPAGGVVRPGPGQVQGPVDEGRALGRGVGQEHPHLGVRRPADGAGVLRAHPAGLVALLDEPGLVHDEHAAGRVARGAPRRRRGGRPAPPRRPTWPRSSRRCTPCGPASPRASASCHPFLRSTRPSRPVQVAPDPRPHLRAGEAAGHARVQRRQARLPPAHRVRTRSSPPARPCDLASRRGRTAYRQVNRSVAVGRLIKTARLPEGHADRRPGRAPRGPNRSVSR